MREKFSTACFCNFCGKGAGDVGKLIASPGPDQAHICGGCILAFVNGGETDMLIAQLDVVLRIITQLSKGADQVRARTLTKFSNDLYYASNRAWHELDAIKRQGQGNG